MLDFGFRIFRQLRVVEMEGRNPTKAQDLSILPCLLLFRSHFQGLLVLLRFTGAKGRLGSRTLGLGFWILSVGFRIWVWDLGY